jgi:hypothetical protein
MAQPIRPGEQTLAEYQEAARAEYGEWVAAQDIYAGLALAYVRGHPVPSSNVEAHGYDKTDPPMVVKRNTKAGREITGEPEPEPKAATRTARASGGNE